MPNYTGEVEYKVTHWDTVPVEADDVEQAEQFIRETVYETIGDVTDVTITTIKEV